MGYDMYVRDASESAENTYLRRSIFGGVPFAEALIGFGMGFDPGPVPSFPDPDEFDLKFGDDGWEGERLDEFRAAVTSVLDWHGPEDKTGIPVHKVCSSNDGWHVTKAECEQALAAYRKAMADGGAHPEAFDDDVIPFLECAAAHDGFETC
ncbi:hypothetical protein DMC63_01385 [Streptomyces sp. WAC 05977]|nr:hypothetical protein DMC63_01385 [Streptomyces sp. WAC 05977]